MSVGKSGVDTPAKKKAKNGKKSKKQGRLNKEAGFNHEELAHDDRNEAVDLTASSSGSSSIVMNQAALKTFTQNFSS